MAAVSRVWRYIRRRYTATPPLYTYLVMQTVLHDWSQEWPKNLIDGAPSLGSRRTAFKIFPPGPPASNEPSRSKALPKMFAFAIALPGAVGSRFPNRAVCKKRSTVMIAADVSSPTANQKLQSVENEAEKVASKSKVYQSKEYSPEEIDQLKKKRAFLFMNRKASCHS